MIVLTFWLRLLLLSVFGQALWVHLWHPGRLQRTLADMRVPRVSTAAGVVTASDGLVCALLVLAPDVGGFAASTYLALVTGAILIADMVGRRPRDCGCGPQTRAPDGTFVTRNVLLAASGVIVAVAAQPSVVDAAGALAIVAFALHQAIEVAVPRLARRDEVAAALLRR